MVNLDHLRNQKWRLGIIRHFEEVTHNVSKTCRYFGISRNAFYKWQRRYVECGEEDLIDRSRRPIHSSRATKPEILAKIIYLRQTHHFGPWKIMVYLKRYHDIHISSSGIWRILEKLQMSRLPVNQRYKRHQDRWKRYEKPMPGHRIQDSRKRYYQYTAIDDCTRLRVLRIYDKNNQKTAIQFIDYALSRLPFRTEVIQTDNVLSSESSSFSG
jgi:transposase